MDEIKNLLERTYELVDYARKKQDTAPIALADRHHPGHVENDAEFNGQHDALLQDVRDLLEKYWDSLEYHKLLSQLERRKPTIAPGMSPGRKGFYRCRCWWDAKDELQEIADYLQNLIAQPKEVQIVKTKEQYSTPEKEPLLSRKGILGTAFFIISLVAIIVFLISYFVQPILPPDTNYAVLLLVASIVGVVSFLAALNEVVELLQKVTGSKNEGNKHSAVSGDSLLLYCHRNPPYNSVKMLYVGSEIAKDLCVEICYLDSNGDSQTKLIAEFYPKEDPKMMWHNYKYDFMEPGQVAYFHLVKNKSTSDGKARVVASFTGAKSGKSVKVEKEFTLEVF